MGQENNTVKCQNCGTIFEEKEKRCPCCDTIFQKKEDKQSFILLAIILLIFIVGIYSIYTNNKIKTSGVWAETKNYMFAVEVDDFDGDVYESGIYKFEANNVRMNEYPKKIPIIWDIYISNNNYPNIYYLKDDEYAGSVGGITNESIKCTLFSGNYVYVVYNQTANTPMGVLNITKLKF